MLTGWGEIARFLGITPRTAQNYEATLGLPVSRMPGAKGRVYADPEELAEWQSRTLTSRDGPNGGVGIRAALPGSGVEKAPMPSTRARRFFGVAALAAIAGSLGIVALITRPNGVPGAFHMSGRKVTVADVEGRPLWGFMLPGEPGMRAYDSDERERLSPCSFADLDGTGEIRTLFAFYPFDVGESGRLLCFGRDGRQRWSFVPGQKVTMLDGREFAPPFRVGRFQILRGRGMAKAKVVVNSRHYWSFPNQIAVLDHDGNLLSEYWHRGHLVTLAVADLNGDGEPELLAAGVNDAPEYARATLLIFDHRRISGASRSPSGEVYFKAMPPGSEIAEVFFPKSKLSENQEFNIAAVLAVGRDRIWVSVAESVSTDDGNHISYELDFKLNPVTVGLSDRTVNSYLQKFPTRLARQLINSEPERLRRGVLVIRR